MKKIDNVIQTVLAVVLMDICGSTDPMWLAIYGNMTSNNDQSNLKSSCPWTYESGTIELVYKDGRCLDLDRLNSNGPEFLTNGRCQPVFCHACCMRDTAIAYMCIHNYRRNILIGKRNGGHDSHVNTMTSLPVTKNITNDQSSSNVIKPIVQTTDVPTTIFTKTTKQSNIRSTQQTSVYQSVQKQTSPLYRFLFPQYLLDNNAQFQPKIFVGQTPLLRPMSMMRSGGQSSSQENLNSRT